MFIVRFKPNTSVSHTICFIVHFATLCFYYLLLFFQFSCFKVNVFISQIRQALDAGVNVNEKFGEDAGEQHEGMTPLALAAALNKVETVKVSEELLLFDNHLII